MFEQNETSKSEKFKTSPLKRNETMESPSLHFNLDLWWERSPCDTLLHLWTDISCSLSHLNPQVYHCNRADIYMHSSEKLPHPGKESDTKKQRLGFSHWASPICMSPPRGSSGPQPSHHNPGFPLRLSEDICRKGMRFPAWSLLPSNVCWGLFHSFLSTLGEQWKT